MLSKSLNKAHNHMEGLRPGMIVNQLADGASLSWLLLLSSELWLCRSALGLETRSIRTAHCPNFPPMIQLILTPVDLTGSVLLNTSLAGLWWWLRVIEEDQWGECQNGRQWLILNFDGRDGRSQCWLFMPWAVYDTASCVSNVHQKTSCRVFIWFIEMYF